MNPINDPLLPLTQCLKTIFEPISPGRRENEEEEEEIIVNMTAGGILKLKIFEMSAIIKCLQLLNPKTELAQKREREREIWWP